MLSVICKIDRPDRQPMICVVSRTKVDGWYENSKLIAVRFYDVISAKAYAVGIRNGETWNGICAVAVVAWGDEDIIGVSVKSFDKIPYSLPTYYSVYKKEIIAAIKTLADKSALCPACGRPEHEI